MPQFSRTLPLLILLWPGPALGQAQSPTEPPKQDTKPCVSKEASQEVLRLGRSLGFPDDEIVEAYGLHPCATLAYLRGEVQKKAQPNVSAQPASTEQALKTGFVKCQTGATEVFVLLAPRTPTVVASSRCGERLDVLQNDGQLWTKVRTQDGKVGYIPRQSVSDLSGSEPQKTTSTAAPSAALAKEKSRITIEVVGTQTGERQFTYTTPGTPATSKTNCDTSGTTTGTITGTSVDGTIHGTTDCKTTYDPGTPATTHVNSITQADVQTIMPDGVHAKLWCQVQWRRCDALRPGHYSADVKGDTVWVYVPDPSGKEHKVKYKLVETW